MIEGKRKASAIIAHPYWGRGGAESAAMWIIEALVRDFEITVYTRGGFNLQELNAIAGTEIPANCLTVHQANLSAGLPLGAFRTNAFMRSLSSVGASFDLRITASGVLPWALPALQFLSSIEWNPALTKNSDPDRKNSLHTRLLNRLIHLSDERLSSMTQDQFIANSHWLKERCKALLPAPISVIHPALPDLPEGTPWKDREEAVLVFGRISPEKRIEDAIQIVERARASGFPGRLLIAGPKGAADYTAKIHQLATARDWMEVLPAQTGLDKTLLLNRVKYGLNTCQIEAFGISTAEMAVSGIITLVPINTGQSEIIDSQDQQFTTLDDAAMKLVLFSRESIQECQLKACASHVRDRFSTKRFVSSVREHAQQMNSRKSGHQGRIQ